MVREPEIPQILTIVQELLDVSPILNTFELEFENSREFIKILQRMTAIDPLERIIRLSCMCKENYHYEYLHELSQILPHLKYLDFKGGQNADDTKISNY
jgi:hypothetical protein